MSLFPATRWSLIERLPGQPQQAADLLALYADAVAGYLAAKLAGESRDRIDDTVQDVLLDLLGKPEVLARARPGEGSRFRHYLMRLAWDAARNALRRARRRDHAAWDEAHDAAPAPDQTEAMDRAWARSVVHQALTECDRWAADGTLPPEAVVVLRRHLVDGQDLRTIARDLGLSLATCSRRLALARTHLQGAIAERLRLAGDLGPDEDPARACALLLGQSSGAQGA